MSETMMTPDYLAYEPSSPSWGAPAAMPQAMPQAVAEIPNFGAFWDVITGVKAEDFTGLTKGGGYDKKVETLQRVLIDLGYGAGLGEDQDDGKFGPNTEAAVAAFQTAFTLEGPASPIPEYTAQLLAYNWNEKKAMMGAGEIPSEELLADEAADAIAKAEEGTTTEKKFWEAHKYTLMAAGGSLLVGSFFGLKGGKGAKGALLYSGLIAAAIVPLTWYLTETTAIARLTDLRDPSLR